MTSSSTDRPDHWWHDPDGDGHNCAFCSGNSIWKCDPAAHLEPSAQEQEFVRRVVNEVGRMEHDMTAETVVGFAYRITDCLLHEGQPMALTDDNVSKVAVMMIAVSEGSGSETNDVK